MTFEEQLHEKELMQAAHENRMMCKLFTAVLIYVGIFLTILFIKIFFMWGNCG